MPYIITTRQESFMESTAGLSKVKSPASRRAVATLGEARSEAAHVVAAADDTTGRLALLALNAASVRAAELPEQGGTIGPLPDGTVIEVEWIEWPKLGKIAGYAAEQRVSASVDPDLQADLIDAYNTAQGERV